MKLRPALLLLSLIPAALQLSTAAAAAVEEEKTPVPASTKDSASTGAVPLRPADESSPDKQTAEPLDGAALLEDCIASPGGYNQMCMLPELLPSSVPMPFGAVLVSRHYFLSPKNIRRLQASRSLIIPVLIERLRAIRIETPLPDHKDTQDNSRSGQNSRSLGPILLGIVQTLNAVECLPDLLRLEQDLHELIAKAETDAAVALPDLILDSPSAMLAVMHDEQSPSSDSSDGKGKARSTQDPTSPEVKKKRERTTALITCKIYQRELLGLMKTLLQYEDYAPIKSSNFVKAQQSEGRKQLLEAAAEVKSPDDLWYGIRPLITWDAAAGKAHANEGAVMQVRLPYTPAVRNEIRSLTEAFLKEGPPEKRKAGTAFGL